jgi:hypothetical protein
VGRVASDDVWPLTEDGKRRSTKPPPSPAQHARQGDIRRGYATLNADSPPAPVLQRKMRHKSFTTTLRYIRLANKMKQGSERLCVPEFLEVKTG